MVNKGGNSIIKRKSIIPSILGTTSIIWTLSAPYLGNYQSRIFFLSLLGAIICAMIGLTLGIKELKLSKKIPVIVGIMLSLIGLLFSLYILFGWIIVGGPLWIF